jgi:hypothetical protein
MLDPNEKDEEETTYYDSLTDYEQGISEIVPEVMSQDEPDVQEESSQC